MKDQSKTGRTAVWVMTGLLALGAWAWFYASHSDRRDAVPARGTAEADDEQVHAVCARCHAYPPPDSLPRSAWKRDVQRGYEFLDQAGMSREGLPEPAAVTAYYENRAPAALLLQPRRARSKMPVTFERNDYTFEGSKELPAISNVRFAHYSDSRKLDVLACDMLNGRILLLKPYEAKPRIETLAEGLSQPAHVEVVDLDGDGVKDLLVANLGNFYPTNDKCGSVVWLRGTREGRFEPHTLLRDVGRVADAQAADLNGDGKLDVAVAVFGWNTTGEVIYLENQTSDCATPKFPARVLDVRHGAIHVPIGDVNGDGKPDIVALLSQETEAVVAYLNDGKGQFTRENVFTGPHPAFGSSGIQLVDLNRDGRLDVLYTNGDSLDSGVLRPYHGVRWLENQGRFPFADHQLAHLCGAHRAVAADFDLDGLHDVLAVSFLPKIAYLPYRNSRTLESVLLMKQVRPGVFEEFCMELDACDYPTCDVGDYDADGDIDVVIGSLERFAGAARTEGETAARWVRIVTNRTRSH